MQEIDFIANALIEADKNYKQNYINRIQLNEYKTLVGEYLKRQDIIALEGWSGNFSDEAKEFSEYFLQIFKSDEGALYFIKSGVTMLEVYGHFRGRISNDIQKAFEAEECYKCLCSSGNSRKLNITGLSG